MFGIRLKKSKLRLSDFGPGIISGLADHDPAGIVTYSLIGATTGFSQLWLALLACPLLIYVLSTCAKIGDVTKKGLAVLIRERFGKFFSLGAMLVLLMANLTTLGADFAGIGQVLSLLFPQITPHFFPLLIAFLILLILVLREYRVVFKYLLWLSLVFICYILAGLLVKPDWIQVLKETFLPSISFSRSYFLNVVAFLGTTITPFLFYWQVTEEVEDHPSLKDARKEGQKIAFGVFFASLISYFVILTSSVAFFQKEARIETITDAALGLQPLLGNYAYLFFTIGLVASGLLAITVIASSTAYAIAETFGWRDGLGLKVSQAKGFYAVLAAIFIIGVLIPYLNIPPLRILFYSQVLNGFLAPVLLAMILVLASSRKIMGRFRHTRGDIFLGVLVLGVMVVSAAATLVGD